MHYSLLVIGEHSPEDIIDILDKYSSNPYEENMILIECEEEFNEILNDPDNVNIPKHVLMQDNGYYFNHEGKVCKLGNDVRFGWCAIGGRWKNILKLKYDIKFLDDIYIVDNKCRHLESKELVFKCSSAKKIDIDFNDEEFFEYIYSYYDCNKDEWLTSEDGKSTFINQLKEKIDSTKDDDRVTIVDCHC